MSTTPASTIPTKSDGPDSRDTENDKDLGQANIPAGFPRLGAWLCPRMDDGDPAGAVADALELAENRVDTPGRLDVWNSPAGRTGDTRLGAEWPVLFESDTAANDALLGAIADGAAAGRRQALYTSLPSRFDQAFASGIGPAALATARWLLVERYREVLDAGVSVLVFDAAGQRREHFRAVAAALAEAGYGHVLLVAEPFPDWAPVCMGSSRKAVRKAEAFMAEARERMLVVDPLPIRTAWALCHGLHDAPNPKRRGPSVNDLRTLWEVYGTLVVGRLSPASADFLRSLVATIPTSSTGGGR